MPAWGAKSLVESETTAKAMLARDIDAEKNYVPLTITPKDIITSDQTDRMASCKATLVFGPVTAKLCVVAIEPYAPLWPQRAAMWSFNF